MSIAGAATELGMLACGEAMAIARTTAKRFCVATSSASRAESFADIWRALASAGALHVLSPSELSPSSTILAECRHAYRLQHNEADLTGRVIAPSEYEDERGKSGARGSK